MNSNLYRQCPTCGSDRMKRVRRTVTRQWRGRTYSVPQLTFHECPKCGEQLYEPKAMRKIEAYSPAYEARRTMTGSTPKTNGRSRIVVCPTCGGDRIKRVRRNVKGEYLGHTYVAPRIAFYACPDCGEHVYEPGAIDKIQSYRPVIGRRRAEPASSIQRRKTG